MLKNFELCYGLGVFLFVKGNYTLMENFSGSSLRHKTESKYFFEVHDRTQNLSSIDLRFSTFKNFSYTKRDYNL